MKALVLSDSRVGHENQSRDFCHLLSLNFSLIKVSYKHKIAKVLSYILDKISLHVKIFSHQNFKGEFGVVVATGSSTYYPALYFSKKLNIPAIALMYPSGYGLENFKYIIASPHDNPKNLQNIIQIPANISHVEPSGIFAPKKKSIGIIIGGNNNIFTIKKEKIQTLLHSLKDRYKEYEIAITTSPRTPREIEEIVQEMEFSFTLIYSRDKQNPIGDFLFSCEEVYITIDSTSMISQAISSGKADICIIPLEAKDKANKYQRFADNLLQNDYAYFYGNTKKSCKKFDMQKALSGIKL